METRRRPEEDALVVVAKYPEPGRVKTRLARQIGEGPAAELYLAFLQDIAERFGRSDRPLHWAYTPAHRDFVGLMGHGSLYLAQKGHGLDQRLRHIFRQLLAQGFRHVVAMGADSPQVSPDWVEEAFARLGSNDVVLGPAEDGGYYLVGLKEPHDIFSGVAWSTGVVLAQTLEKARVRGLSVHLLPTTFDVDQVEDLAKLRHFLAENPEALPHTARVMAKLLLGTGGPGPMH